MVEITATPTKLPGVQRPPLWRAQAAAPAWPARTPTEAPPEGGPVILIPTILLTPATIAFTGESGDAPPPSKTILVTNVGEGDLVLTVSDDAPWLTVSPITSRAPSVLTILANPGSLSPGFYSESVRIDGAHADNSPQLLIVSFSVIEATPVTMIVTPDSLLFEKLTGAADPDMQEILIEAAPEQALDVDPHFLHFTKFDGFPDPVSQTFEIENVGTGVMDYLVTKEVPWLTVTPSSGTAPDTVEVTVAQGALAPGTYETTITVTSIGAVGSPRLIPVQFIIEPSAGDFVDLDTDAGIDLDEGETVIWTGTDFIDGEI